MKNEAGYGRIAKDLTGMKFGKLTVVKMSPNRDKNGHILWESNCDCGGTRITTAPYLVHKVNQSCGCYYPTRGNKKLQKIRKIWHGMIERCYKPYKQHHRYKRAGITICDEWKNDPMKFIKWAVENGYKDGLTIDRYPNTMGNYEPGNCRWATLKQQNNNKSNNRLLTIDGITNTAAQWSELTKIPQALISQRITRLGWDEKTAVMTKINEGISERRILRNKSK